MKNIDLSVYALSTQDPPQLTPCLTPLSDTIMSVMPIFCKLPPSTPVRSGQFSSHFLQEAEHELGLDAHTAILPSAAHIM